MWLFVLGMIFSENRCPLFGDHARLFLSFRENLAGRESPAAGRSRPGSPGNPENSLAGHSAARHCCCISHLFCARHAAAHRSAQPSLPADPRADALAPPIALQSCPPYSDAFSAGDDLFRPCCLSRRRCASAAGFRTSGFLRSPLGHRIDDRHLRLSSLSSTLHWPSVP